MTTEEKIEILINNINAVNFSTAITGSSLNIIHDFEIKITSFNVSSLVTTVKIESTEELNLIVNTIIDSIKHLTFNYIVKDYRIQGNEIGYMYIHYPRLYS
jgi:hypothetical protein